MTKSSAAIAMSDTEPSSTCDPYPVHPCAAVFPMMSDGELEQLAEDIRTNGLREPIAIYWPAKGEQQWLLDGRNRLEACRRANVVPTTVIIETESPAVYVISRNIRRRHLSKEQQAALIVQTIEAVQNDDRAKPARSFSPTSGQRGGSTKDPVLAEAVEEAAKHDISKRTVQNARAKLQGKTPKKIGLSSSTPPTSEATPLVPPPPSTYEWLDDQLTDLRKKQDQILARYTELDVTEKLTAAERRTVRDRLTHVRSRVDQLIVHFGGTHKKLAVSA